MTQRHKSIKEWIDIMQQVEKDIPADKLKKFEECKEDSKKLDVLIGLLKKIDGALEQLSQQEKEDETDHRVHLMIHRLIDALRTDHELIGVEALSLLLIGNAKDKKINLEIFLTKMRTLWNEDAEQEDDDGEDDED